MPDLVAARSQMALSLGWHIVLACYGVGFPLIVLLAEWRALRTGDAAYSALARAWTKALGVLFAIGAVSGTILSFELGILWPRFTGRFGEVVGLPFAMEGIAFFVEAIFVGLYLYGLGPPLAPGPSPHRPAHPRAHRPGQAFAGRLGRGRPGLAGLRLA